MVHVLVSGRVLDKNVGGNSRYARELYSRINRHGVEHDIARPLAASDGRFRSVQYAFYEGLAIPIVSTKADVIHFPADTGAWTLGRKPIVGTVHGLASMHVSGVRSAAAEALWKKRVGRLVTVASRIITVSESSARDIADSFPGSSSKIAVIHHGIDHERFRPADTRLTPNFLLERGITGPYFAYVGNIEPRKNLVALAGAGKDVFRKTGVPLVVSGAPAWDFEDIMSVLAETEGVHYIGRTSDKEMVELLQNAVGFCFPSKYEGFGFPVLEAMACGTPVICSTRGSLGEVVGDAALTIESIDVDTISNAMLELLVDNTLQVDLIARGYRNARQFQWETSAKSHADVFAEVA